MRRPGVRIPSRPPSFKTTSSVPNSSYRGTLGLSSLSDSFRYLVIHPERHCLCAASSVNTSRLTGLIPQSKPDSFRSTRELSRRLHGYTVLNQVFWVRHDAARAVIPEPSFVDACMPRP